MISLFVVLAVSPSFATVGLSNTIIENEEISSITTEPIDQKNGETTISPMSIENPVKAYLVVATNSYGAPNPSTGHLQEAVPANTNVWVVEMVWCSYNSRYYYYAGYTYNGASHRGYFCEDNVYKNGAKFSKSNTVLETKPANLKQHIVKENGTVYDGPNTTYSKTGSVYANEKFKLIRTEGNYNFIEYTVSSTGKLKRGFLTYTNVTGEWGDLSEDNKNKLNGYSFFIQNKKTEQFMDVKTWSRSNSAIIHQWNYHGDSNQVFKFIYHEADKNYSIQPLNNILNFDGCTENKNLMIGSSSDGAHADRKLCIYTQDLSKNTQRFWVVKVIGVTDGYKIVPVSSYGTMCLTNRTSGETYVNQYYTDTTSSGNDVWYIRPYHIVENTQSMDGYDYYDRSGSLQYQYEHHDEKNGKQNQEYEYYDEDCTNYVSQCLHDEKAGTLPEIGNSKDPDDREDIERWYYDDLLIGVLASRSWTYAPSFAKHWAKTSDGDGNFTGNMRCYQIIEFTNEKTAAKYRSKFEEFVYTGDIVQQKPLGNYKFNVKHSMIVAECTSEEVELTDHTSAMGTKKTVAEYLSANKSETTRPVIYVITPEGG